MHIALYGRSLDARNREGVAIILRTLAAAGYRLSFFHKYAELIRARGLQVPEKVVLFDKLEDLTPEPDYFLSLGGDGTLLSALPILYPCKVPVAAVNVGRLGYLTSVELSAFEALLKALETGRCVVEERSLVEAFANGQKLDAFGHGLNEFTVVKTDTSSMINVETYVDDIFFSNIWADGLVLSTPTGSTAYALSCGGPVITPACPVLLMAAIAPHNLNVRPIVFSDSVRFRFIVQSRSTRFIASLDSRFVYLPVGTEILVQRSAWRLPLVRLHTYDHLETLRNKLLWGNDMRNVHKFN